MVAFAVSGDVVIEGYFKGSGEIIAGGNLYIAGSIHYPDGVDEFGNRTYGVGADGTENRLTLASGGNIVVGDILTNKKGEANATETVSGPSTSRCRK